MQFGFFVSPPMPKSVESFTPKSRHSSYTVIAGREMREKGLHNSRSAGTACRLLPVWSLVISLCRLQGLQTLGVENTHYGRPKPNPLQSLN